MHLNKFAGVVIVAIMLVAPAEAQQREPSSFMTNVKPQDVVFQKVIDVPDFAGPQMKPQTTDRFSLRQMLAKVVPFLSPNAKPSYQTAVPALPGSTTPSPLQPVLPQFGLPKTPAASPFMQALPRTTFPNVPDNSTLRPVLPIP